MVEGTPAGKVNCRKAPLTILIDPLVENFTNSLCPSQPKALTSAVTPHATLYVALWLGGLDLHRKYLPVR